MINPSTLDEAFKEFSQNFSKWLPDGIISININVLHDLGLLNSNSLDKPVPDNLSHQFHVIETTDKVTLYNQQFAIWIVPQNENNIPSTMAMIALLQQETPHLEIVYKTSGVYNTPRYILRILQHYLTEVIDTQNLISSMEDHQEP